MEHTAEPNPPLPISPEKRRFKILHVITRLDKGGSSENTLLTALGLVRNRYSVDILCGSSNNPPSEKENEAIACGVRIFRSPFLVRAVALQKDLLATWHIFRKIRSEHYDLVHTHTSKAGLLGRIAARCAGVRRIVHTPHGHVFHGYFSARKTRIFVLLERFCMRFTSMLVTLTETGKREHLAVGIGPAARIIAIPSGIELKPFLSEQPARCRARRLLGIGEDRFVVGSIARLVSIKNHRLIVDAASECIRLVPNIFFVFVGDGPRRLEIEKQILDKKLGAFFSLQGWRADIPSILPAFDLFVMPSLNEGMGRAFVEAQAAGVPVIGPRVGGVPDVIREGETGLLIDPAKPEELARAIVKLNDSNTQTQMARACRDWVNPQFSAERMVERIDRLYQTLLADPS